MLYSHTFLNKAKDQSFRKKSIAAIISIRIGESTYLYLSLGARCVCGPLPLRWTTAAFFAYIYLDLARSIPSYIVYAKRYNSAYANTNGVHIYSTS
jgi:hypothetical protein